MFAYIIRLMRNDIWGFSDGSISINDSIIIY